MAKADIALKVQVEYLNFTNEELAAAIQAAHWGARNSTGKIATAAENHYIRLQEIQYARAGMVQAQEIKP